MEPCYKEGHETAVMWGHRWNLCAPYPTKSEATEHKKRLERKGKVAIVQKRAHLVWHSYVYLVWWRNG